MWSSRRWTASVGLEPSRVEASRLSHHRGSGGPPLSTKYLISERLQRQTRTTFSRSEGPPLSTKYLICERLQRQTRTTRGGARGHRFQQNTSSVNDSSVKRERPEAERGATAFNKIPHLQHLSSGLTAARRYTARRHQAP